MPAFHQLSTQKYVDEAMQQEQESVDRQKSRESLLLLAQFVFSVLVLVITMIGVYTLPYWMPSMNVLLEQAGILNS